MRAEGLSLSYGQEPVLRDVSVAFPEPEAVAITGPSGSGKTSLLYGLSGLERRVSGSVFLLGEDVTRLSADALANVRLQRFGFVFQSSDLVPELTLRQNVALPLQLARTPRAEVRDRVNELLIKLDLAESADRRPAQVSGGQAQRCAVARAVVARPKVVFADEPTGALDRRNREVVLDLLLDQVRQIDALLVTVTHDPGVASRHQRRISLQDGEVVEDVREARLAHHG